MFSPTIDSVVRTKSLTQRRREVDHRGGLCCFSLFDRKSEDYLNSHLRVKIALEIYIYI